VKTGPNVAERENILPTSLPPRGLSRVQSAAYIGVSATLFDELVRDGRMPQPIRLNSRLVWDRLQLDDAFVALSDIVTGGNDPWSKVAV
jgi:predicted DNA-binding transcriptional regulator AlpA